MFGFYKKILKKTKEFAVNNACFLSSKDAVWMNKDYRSFAQEAYIKNVVAHRAIELISQAAASIPFKLYHNSKEGRVTVNSHEILNLLTKPSAFCSGKSFMQSIYTYRLIHGNAYIMAITAKKQLQPKELVTLRPDRVEVVPSKKIFPLGYKYIVDNIATYYPVNQVTCYSKILHIKNLHPLSDWYGLSNVEAAAYSIDQHNQAGSWNQSLLQNGARPSGAIIVKQENGKNKSLTDEQLYRLKNMVNEIYSGPQNAGRPLVLEGGLEWQEMSLSPRDMDYIESKNSAARDIALAFGVPPQLLGIPGDNKYDNLVEARIALWEQTIIPLVDNVVEHISNWLTPLYGNDLELGYDLDKVSALSRKRESLWDKIQNAEFMTVNEKRELLGMKAIENGDKLDNI